MAFEGSRRCFWNLGAKPFPLFSVLRVASLHPQQFIQAKSQPGNVRGGIDRHPPGFQTLGRFKMQFAIRTAQIVLVKKEHYLASERREDTITEVRIAGVIC